MIILPILTTSLIYFSLVRLGECTFSTWEWKGWPFHSQEWSISKFPCSLTRNIASHSKENLAFHSFKVGTHEGTCCRVMSRVLIPTTNPIVWTFSFHEKSCCGDEILCARPVPWIQIILKWGDMSQRQNNGRTRKVASRELFMQHVPAALEKNKPIRRRHLSSQKHLQETYPRNMLLRVNSAWNSSPRHAPATCPLVCADLWEMIILPILTTSLIRFSLKGRENVLLKLGSDGVRPREW